ncbi:hypothetical protein [Sphingomonas oryzagri]|uniref:Uncharacterized protein n=1 Tax=Sphingomonas oryzagri TaxID=3042314 RepID=A0ABT6N1Q5_9SPHN|nr:hypothetical protein [Sphingomonas oryzagri]MDH7639220.1 hypothetical protein [Sphingomonas oryzagri]
MRAKRIEIATSVATRLFAAEQAINVAATRIAELNAVMPMASIEARIAPEIGQDAFESSIDALSLVARAREQIVVTHRRLRTAGDEMGLQTVSFGDSAKPPSAQAAAPSPTPLRIAS